MIKIAVTGPESSGKTTLVNYLTERFNGCRVDEYAREYMGRKNIVRNYTVKNLIEMATRQFELNKGNSCDKEYLICDTEMTVMKIWAEDKFGYCPNEILQYYEEQDFDIYFLCKPDFEWQFDDLREDKNRLDFLYLWYINQLDASRVLYFVVEGEMELRTKNAERQILSL